MKIPNLSGTGVAIVTPFNKNLEIDFYSFKKLIDFQINNGVNYLVFLGTTGESATLTKSEKQKVKEFAVNQVGGRVPIVLGLGNYDTQDVVNHLKTDNFTGIDALLSVTPYYNKPNQKGLFEHYKTIAENSSLPIILYNVPGRTGVNMLASTTLSLANEFNNIIAIKEASGNFDQISRIINEKPQGFQVISGDDSISVPLISIGACGVISVTANAFPLQFSTMIKFALEGNFKKAAQIHLQLLDVFSLMFEEGSPTGIKAALNISGIIENYLRLPLTAASDNLFQKIELKINELKK